MAGLMDDPDSIKWLMAMQGFQQFGNAMSQIGAMRRGVPYQGPQSDPARTIQVGLMMKEAAAKEAERKQKLAAQAQLFGMAGSPWTNPDTGQIGNGGGLMSQLGLSPEQQKIYTAAGLMDPGKAAGGLMDLAKPRSPKERYMDVGGRLVDVAGDQPKEVMGKAPSYKERDLPTAGDKVQKQVSYDDGQTWQNIGTSYDRREPFIIQDIVQPDGSVQRVMIPKAGLTGTPSQEQQPYQPQLQPGFLTGQSQPSPAPSGAPSPQSAPGIPGSRIISEKPATLTDSQSSSALYADRMRESHGIITSLESQGTNTAQSAMSAVPLGVGNMLISGQRQQYEQAQRDFVNAVLRRESGAVISDEEFTNAKKQYFPQPGDSSAVIEQKRRNRETAINGITRAAGPAYKPAAKLGKNVPALPPGFQLID